MKPSDLGIGVPDWREGQLEAIYGSLASKRRAVVHNAPVGSGKSITLIGEALLSKKRTLILTGTKPLQNQYCLAPETKVLKTSLEWVPIGTIETGDSLLAFDEEREGTRRMWRAGKVLSVARLIKPCYWLTFDDGTSIVASADHKWLTATLGGGCHRWITTEQMRVAGKASSKVIRVLNVWSTQETYASGYLAAAFDGEGWLVQTQTKGNGVDVNLGFSQKNNQMWAEVTSLLDDMNMPYNANSDKNGMCRLTISGRHKTIQFLGEIRPKRLLAKFDPSKLGMIGPVRRQTLVKKEFIGEQTVVAVETSTGTFVAEGLASHNCSDFSSLHMLDVRGKSNYRCRATELGGEFYDGTPTKHVHEAPCQFGVECGLRLHGCTYYDLIREASFRRLVISNYAAWISANMYTEGWGHFPLIMCDEAHEAEHWLQAMLSVKLPLGFSAVLGRFPNTTDPLVWATWAYDILPEVKQHLKDMQEKTRTSRGRKVKLQVEVKVLQESERALTRIKDISEDWLCVFNPEHVLFHPVWVRKYAEQFLFRSAEKIVLASATIVPYELGLLGLANEDYEYFEYPSTFPVANRPIHFFPVTKMHYGMEAEDTLAWIDVVDQFISKRLDRKGIIHTVSFARQRQILQHSRFASLMVVNTSSATTQATLQKFRAAKAPAILVTPSMATGVDLSYRTAEYAVIPKMPFDNINDPVLMARSAEDPDYAAFQAAKALLQMTGRIVRAKDDRGETLITDQNFNLFRTRYKHMLPKYFWQAVRKVEALPEPLEKL